MGSGRYDDDVYTSSRASRVASKTPDFAYTATAAATKTIHPTLDPMRINSKPSGKLESRDSDEHPESNAIFVSMDVTGSNKSRAVDAQARLNNLMGLLTKYVSDPQVLVAANDDYDAQMSYCGTHAGTTQISDFESDNRIDEAIRNLWLVGNGGGNDWESYDLLLYAAARKTVIDCFDKRGKKGYMFMYADEPFFKQVSKDQVKAVFGDDIEADIPLVDIIDEVKERYNLFILWPQGGYDHARKQYVELFGEEHVVTLQHPNLICEMIASLVGFNEDKLTASDAMDDLVAVGVDKSSAKDIVSHASTALVPTTKSTAITRKKSTGASRL